MKPTRWFVLAALALLPAVVAAVDFDVTINTTPLAGRSGYIALDLLAGSPGALNEVQLSSFVSTSTLGVSTTLGDVSGNLASTLTLRSSVFFSQALQALVFGPGLTQFSLSLSDSTVAGGIPDSFSLFLLDTNFAPFATSDPAGALILVDLRPPLSPQVFTSAFATASVSLVPEPAQRVFLPAGLAAVLLAVAWRSVGVKKS